MLVLQLQHDVEGRIKMDFDTYRFTSAETAKAARFTQSGFHMMFKRGNFQIRDGEGTAAPQNGLPNLFNLRAVIGFALTNELMTFGVPAKIGFQASKAYTHISEGAREPSGLFDIHKQGYTGFIFWPDAGHGRTFSYESAPTRQDLFRDLNHHENKFCFVQMNNLHNRIAHELRIAE